ncbi:MAG: methylenetetrahydrofolate reductase [Candidatus Odinarchaeota archaeon]|nr:methylenetetrahydrofolate reductase [Candidatus Odinarchaeota archaeon]
MVYSKNTDSSNGIYLKFFEKIMKDRFVFTFEVGCLKGFTIRSILKNIGKVKRFFDAFVVPDNPFAKVFPHPLALCDKIRRENGVDVVMTICCRDKNRLAIQSEVLGAELLDIRNIVVVTGDSLSKSDGIKNVFDVNSIQAIKMIKNMITQENISNKLGIGERLKLHVGAVVNLSSRNLEEEVERFFMKIDAGAEYAFTQIVFDPNLLVEFKDNVGKIPIPVIVSIYPITSWEQICFLTSFSSFEIPPQTIAYFRQKRKDTDMGVKEALNIAFKAKELGFNGVHIICKNVNLTVKLVKRLKEEVS